MLEAWPKPCTPRSCATCRGAGLSVCWQMMSAPWSISALAASPSLPGSYQLLTQTTLTWVSGLTFCISIVKALMPITTSGIGKEPM